MHVIGAPLVRDDPTASSLPSSYPTLLAEIKAHIRTARSRAILSVNCELVCLYWRIGQIVVERQRLEGWGAAVVNHLAHDLRRAFPAERGFSPSNLRRMRAFYLAYSEGDTNSAQAVRNLPPENLAQPVRDSIGSPMPEPLQALPWGHNILLIERLQVPAERLWYARETHQHGWSRAVLGAQIASNLYQRQGKSITNFERTLPPQQSDLAQQTLKDPYVFEFISTTSACSERQLESRLILHVKNLLLELGRGFAFVGSQYPLKVGGEEFFIDLLFYHLNLRRFVLIELKVGKFRPEHVGKMSFYLTAVDRQLRHVQDEASIGLVLCRERNRVVAEYALQDCGRPLGIATYQLIPDEIRKHLPSPGELGATLAGNG